jgi:ubiquinone/menaquinone biosynthesis C-methylase UbiE
MGKPNFWDDLSGDDDHAADYMRSYGEGPGFETRHTLGAFINPGETVLDVGCGPGWNLDHFQEYGPPLGAYKGIDYSERFVRVANQRNPEMYELGDVRDIKEPNESWDVVICQDCLEHTNGYEGPVKELIRVAKKRVIVTFWHLTDEDNPHINDDGNDGWGAWYDKREFEKFLNTFPYVWHHTEVQPKDKNHPWQFYIIEKQEDEK